MRDPKDAYNEAYSDALDDGFTEGEAHLIAEEARIDAASALIDDAMDMLKEGRR